jgi:hypothetical protein
MLRTVLFAGAAVALGFVAVAQASETTSRCQDASFRIYFSEDSAELDQAAREMIAAAERNVAECDRAELHVAVDAANPHAAERGRAILSASRSRAWNVRAVEAMPMTRRASFSGSPDYAEVLMTPRVVPVGVPVRDAETGV